MTVPTAEDSLTPTESPRRPLRRLSISELLAAVQAAHGGGDIHCDPPPARPAMEPEKGTPTGSGASRSHAAPVGPDRAADAPMTPESPTRRALAAPSGSATALAGTIDHPDADDTLASWVPDHDGPVSLTDLAAPRRRPSARRTSRPELQNADMESSPRRATPGREGSTLGGREQRALAALRDVGATSIGVLAACGGSGATTVTAVLALTLAKTTGAAVAIGSDATDARWLATRCGVDGVDIDHLTRWLRITDTDDPTAAGLDLPAATRTPDGQLQVVAATRPPGASGPTGLAGRDIPLALRHISGGPAVLDLGTPWSPSAADCLPSVTHLVLTAPKTTTGLIAAEYVIADMTDRLPDSTRPLVLLLTNTAGRAGRPGRAALTRLAGLGVQSFDLPADRHAAAGTAISWPALSVATRKATVALLTGLLLREDNR